MPADIRGPGPLAQQVDARERGFEFLSDLLWQGLWVVFEILNDFFSLCHMISSFLMMGRAL
jgi:hypothetical protein